VTIQEIRPKNSMAILSLDVDCTGEYLVVGQSFSYVGSPPNHVGLPNLTLWSLSNLQLLHEIESLQNESIQSVCFLSDGKTIAYTKSGSNVELYHLDTSIFSQLKIAGFAKLSASKESHCLGAAGIASEVWNTETQERIWFLQDYVAMDIFDHKPAPVTLSADGELVAVAGAGVNQVLIYSLEHDQIVQRLEDSPSQAHWISMSPDSNYIAVIGHFAKGDYIWDLRSGERHLPLIYLSESDGSWCLCFHPNSQYLAIGSLVGYVSIYRLSDGETIFSQRKHEGRVWDLVFTPDGKKLISGGDDGIVSILNVSDILQTGN
jgi:WD40 repeat protein